LKTTMDVITAAKKISEAGTNLDKLTRMIADQCPESSTKKDLLAYLQRIALYCHQLNITSKVKADVQNISGELIVSGVRFAMVWCYLCANNCPFTVGQCHVFDSGGQELDECRRADGESFLRGFHQVPTPGHRFGRFCSCSFFS
jgi:Vinculin family